MARDVRVALSGKLFAAGPCTPVESGESRTVKSPLGAYYVLTNGGERPKLGY
jgi:hypothetical protein